MLVYFIWDVLNGAVGQLVAAFVPNLFAAQIMQGLVFMIWYGLHLILSELWRDSD